MGTRCGDLDPAVVLHLQVGCGGGCGVAPGLDPDLPAESRVTPQGGFCPYLPSPHATLPPLPSPYPHTSPPLHTEHPGAAPCGD